MRVCPPVLSICLVQFCFVLFCPPADKRASCFLLLSLWYPVGPVGTQSSAGVWCRRRHRNRAPAAACPARDVLYLPSHFGLFRRCCFGCSGGLLSLLLVLQLLLPVLLPLLLLLLLVGAAGVLTILLGCCCGCCGCCCCWCVVAAATAVAAL